jgi:hypothetical protein
MPIPSQPTTNISLGPTLSPTSRSISAEFADPAPHSASEFYRGGPRIADHPVNASIPTSSTGTKSFSQFNGGSLVLRYVISSPVQNLNLFNYASSAQRPASQSISQGYDQEKRYTANQPGFGVEFIINPGVIVGSASSTQSALITGVDDASTWHPTVKIRLVNQGQIIGAGGGGGRPPGTNPTLSGPADGQGGGTAVAAQRPLVIQNGGSLIGGGGGGGVGKGIGLAQPNKQGGQDISYVGGGGGGGGVGSTGGLGGIGVTNFSSRSGPFPVFSLPGQSGTTTTAGQGGAGGYNPPQGQFFPSRAGAGGAGGQLATGGQAGNPYVSFPGTAQQAEGFPLPPGAGGAVGYYIVGNPLVSWQATGTRQGQFD